MFVKFKNVICGMLGVLILLSAAACGSQKNNTTDTTVTSTSAATAKPDPFGKYTPAITISTVRTLDSTIKFEPGNPLRDSLEKNIWATAYEEELGIKFNYLWTTDTTQYDTKWNVAIASGDIPDMAVVDGTIYSMLVKSGLVDDMTDIYKNYASDTYKKLNTDDNDLTIKYSMFNGKMLGLPHIGGAPYAIPMLFIRKDWLKQVNMAEPKTIDDLIATAKAFKDAKLGGPQTLGMAISTPLGSGMNDAVGFFNGFGAYYGIWVKDNSGNLVYGSIQPEMKGALLKLQSMYKDGLLAQDFSVKDSAKAGADIVSGNVGIAYGSFAMPILWIQANIQKDVNSQWEVLNMPTLDGSSSKPQSMFPGVNSFIFVKKGYSNPEAAVKIINLNLKLGELSKYQTNDDYAYHLYRFAFGVESPTKNIEMHLAICEALKTGDTSKIEGEILKDYGLVKAGLEGARTDGIWLVMGPAPNSTFGLIKQNLDSNSLVYNVFQSLPTATMISKSSILNTSLDAAIFKVIMGADISVFDKAVGDWKNMGGDAITKEVNDWYLNNK